MDDFATQMVPYKIFRQIWTSIPLKFSNSINKPTFNSTLSFRKKKNTFPSILLQPPHPLPAFLVHCESTFHAPQPSAPILPSLSLANSHIVSIPWKKARFGNTNAPKNISLRPFTEISIRKLNFGNIHAYTTLASPRTTAFSSKHDNRAAVNTTCAAVRSNFPYARRFQRPSCIQCTLSFSLFLHIHNNNNKTRCYMYILL